MPITDSFITIPAIGDAIGTVHNSATNVDSESVALKGVNVDATALVDLLVDGDGALQVRMADLVNASFIIGTAQVDGTATDASLLAYTPGTADSGDAPDDYTVLGSFPLADVVTAMDGAKVLVPNTDMDDPPGVFVVTASGPWTRTDTLGGCTVRVSAGPPVLGEPFELRGFNAEGTGPLGPDSVNDPTAPSLVFLAPVTSASQTKMTGAGLLAGVEDLDVAQKCFEGRIDNYRFVDTYFITEQDLATLTAGPIDDGDQPTGADSHTVIKGDWVAVTHSANNADGVWIYEVDGTTGQWLNSIQGGAASVDTNPLAGGCQFIAPANRGDFRRSLGGKLRTNMAPLKDAAIIPQPGVWCIQ